MTEKKYKTVLHGHKTVLLDDNMGGKHPLLWKALVEGEWYILRTDRDFLHYGKPCIVEVREPLTREPLTRWINDYPTGLAQASYTTKKEADIVAGFDRIACREFREVVK
jgi:hypothetical protein